MITYKNWLGTNVQDRLTDKNVDLKIVYKPTKFKKMTFAEASDYTAEKINGEAQGNLYLALSGGADSEYVLQVFQEQKIAIKPIIVRYTDNRTEAAFAFHACKKYNIEPIVLDCPDDLLYSLFVRELFHKFNVQSHPLSANILILKWLEKNDPTATLVIGHDLMRDTLDSTATQLSIADFTFTYPHISKIPCPIFLMYTPEIVYSIADALDGSDMDAFKSKLYGVNYRPKIRAALSNAVLVQHKTLISNAQFTPKYFDIMGTKEEIVAMMDKWNEKKAKKTK